MAKKKAAAGKRFPACQSCGSRDLKPVTERTYECASCTSVLAPNWLSSEAEYANFKISIDLKRSESLKVWGQRILHRTIPVVVMVNWFTAVYFFTFFLLGMAGFFKYGLFQSVFLYSSILVVAMGFGIIVRWGKARISI